MQLKWTNLADADLDKVEHYISQESSPIVATELVLKIINVTELVLSDHPYAGRQGRVKGTRELIIDGIPYTVIYRNQSEQAPIEILRVLHDAQQWP